MSFPLFLDAKEAIHYFQNTPNITDAEKAYVIRVLSNEGLKNKAIREVLKIEKVYTVTHLKRAGTLLSEDDLALWHKNSSRISLGHIRAIAGFPKEQRESLLRDLLSKRIPVSQYESLAKGKPQEMSADIKSYGEQMEQALGRPIAIQYNQAKRSGSITLRFYGLDDLDDISSSLGFEFDNL